MSKKCKRTNIEVLTILITALMLFLSACQLTPESNIVKQRNFDALLQMATSDSTIEYPLEYTDNFVSKDGKVQVSFDAQITIPNVNKLPVIQIEPQYISKDQIQSIVDIFMEGQSGYYTESYLTKQEIESKLIDLQARIADEDSLYEKYGEQEQVDAAIKNLKNKYNSYFVMLENAPENKKYIHSNLVCRPYDFYVTDDHSYIDYELSLNENYLENREESGDESLFLVSDTQLTNGQYIRLTVYNECSTGIDDTFQVSFHHGEHHEIHMVRSYDSFVERYSRPLTSAYPFNDILEEGNLDESYPELSISLNEAITIAQEALDDLDVNNFYLAYSEIVSATQTYEEAEAMWEKMNNNPSIALQDNYDGNNKFYILTYKPMYNNVPLINANNKFSQQEQYSIPYTFEKIKIRVSNDCIAEFRWINPIDKFSVINDNVKLLSFDEISKSVTNHMKVKYNLPTVAPVWVESPTYNEDLAKYTSAEIKITEIRLGLGGVPAHNNNSEYMLIPVWSFYGTYSVNSIDDLTNIEHTDTFVPIATVNAVDGSIIEQMAFVDYN